MAQITEGATDSVDAVWFNFMTTEEVRKHSVLKLTNANLLDFMNRPMPGGLYDPVLGPLEDRTPCKSCGLLKLHCPGHCGHIDLVSPIYNPLLFNFLHTLIQRTCFFCYHFRAERTEVEKCISQLKLIGKGDIVGAKRLDSDSKDSSSHPENSEGCRKLGSRLHESEAVNPKEWTSLQLTEAMSVLNKFLKVKYKRCKNCDAKNPAITKPTFDSCGSLLSQLGILKSPGFLLQSGMSGSQMRENVIRGCKMADTFSGEVGSDIEDANDASSSEEGVDITKTKTPEIGFKGADGTSAKACKKAKVPLEFLKQKNLFSGPLLPSEVKKVMKLLWENEIELCSLINCIQQQGFGEKVGFSMFFLETVLVPPIKFRAPTKGGDSVMEHPQTVLLSKVLQANISLGNAHNNDLQSSKVIVRLWMDLQQSINLLFDSKTAMSQRRDVSPGICQLLERKEGMFRQKMMGKRVNFACRSVISPDPYLAVNEIGIPPYFALRLTYPERVTPWNVVKLREAIINGSELHPGATHYVDKLSTQRLPPNRKARISISRKLPTSRAAITQPGKNFDYEFEGKIVLRHLQDGDVVLVNRQPTLHKPSIMAHVVRVLKGEKTIRMHYANCSTYNADFDGDEINVHFPQDEISRAEAYNIVNANNQYVRPSNGEPLRALIQDHIVSAVLLTKRDTFLSRDEFNQLLYSSGVSGLDQHHRLGKSGQKVLISSSEEGMLPILPAILKPKPLWTGKQVITAVLNHITRGRPPFTVEKTGKTPRDFFKNRSNENKLKSGGQEGKDAEENSNKEPDEEKILIYKNDLMHGFTCGVDDLLIMNDKDIERKKQLEECEKKVTEAHYEFCAVKVDTEIVGNVFESANPVLSTNASKHPNQSELLDVFSNGREEIKQLIISNLLSMEAPIELQLKIEKTIRRDGEAALTALDRTMISVLNKNSSQGVLTELLSEGLVKPMGRNCISLMTTTGAKGSKVNFQQISSFLGQQELEGKRVPRMVSGKTLPCFHPWDWAARAGGFISDRFLTGLRPQEYYFHCMAGREGGNMFSSLKLMWNLIYTMKLCFLFTARHIILIVEPHLFADGNALFRLSICHLLLGTQPGEPVGVLAAQSVGEPSTQMTLNTFHLAGRGEMNVTLGIPRLQEILMTASIDIKTPVMTCPLHKGKTKEDALRLADKMKKITVAEILESMGVSVTPFAIHNGDICSIYKLKMRLGKPGRYLKNSDITVTDCQHILEKQQATDEMDYEDGSEEEQNEGASLAGLESENDMSEDENGTIENNVIGSDNEKDDIFHGSPNAEDGSKLKSREGNTRAEPKRKKMRGKFIRKETDRAIFSATKGLVFEVHFKFVNEPHILLAQGSSSRKSRWTFLAYEKFNFSLTNAHFGSFWYNLLQIAEKTAKKVYIQSFGKIDQCRVTDCSENQVFYYGEDPKQRKSPSGKANIPALHTAGVDFGAFWKMEGHLDVRYLYSNNIHAMLNTYGVEAARETIISEISNVFTSYGIGVNIRHLTLIADFMTHSGRYRPMSRLGSIAECISPFSKMSFETASKFIVDAAKHGLVDNLETPSSRICLGLPVKMGTGSFGLMQNVEI
ncbi:hypothetical protein GOBAR_DD15973 [Gossypium barbadense]|nr:hypothetical protein GOBAR_DD15973 [Gossypium barbadense]